MAASTCRGNSRRKADTSKRRAFWTHAAGSTDEGVERGHGLDQLVHPSGPQLSGHPVGNRLDGAARPGGDHRAAGGLRLDGGDPELLDRGDHQGPAGGEQLPHVLVVNAAGEANRGAGHPLQAAPVRPGPHHDQRQPQPVEGLDGDVDPLVRHQLGEHQVVVAHLARLQPPGVHGRVDHLRFAAEVRAYPGLRGAGVGQVAVDALSRHPVPHPPAAKQRTEQRAAERIEGLVQRPATLVPRVPERVVAVTDVHRPLLADHRVGPGAGAGDHQVVAAQVEGLDRGGVERQEGAEGARVGTQALEEGGVDVAVRQPPLGAPLVVDGGEDVRIGIQLADLEEDPVGPPQADHEVVDERRPRRGRP